MNERSRGFADRFRDSNPFHNLLAIEVEDSSPGFVRIRLPAAEQLRGGVAGSFHGGVLSALVDIATLGALSGLFTPDEQAAGTAELSISYLRPAVGAYVIAEGRVLKKDSLRLQLTMTLVATAAGWVRSR
jgi:uncharacterized protein (TIGR00369 family)